MHAQRQRIALIGASFAFFLWLGKIGCPFLALAQMPSPQATPSLPPDDKPTTTPGIPRDDCLVGEKSKPLAALIPDSEEKVALTVAGYPTLFFYIPQTRAKEALFVLVDDASDSVIYKDRIRLPSTSGAIAAMVSADTASSELRSPRNYRWTFALICPSDGGENKDIYVSGYIQRVNSPELEEKVRLAAARDVPGIYCKAGIWHDCLSTLARLRRENPDDAELKEYWEKLLTAAGLEAIARSPLIDLSAP